MKINKINKQTNSNLTLNLKMHKGQQLIMFVLFINYKLGVVLGGVYQ